MLDRQTVASNMPALKPVPLKKKLKKTCPTVNSKESSTIGLVAECIKLNQGTDGMGLNWIIGVCMEAYVLCFGSEGSLQGVFALR